MLTQNRTIREYAGSTSQRQAHEARLQAKIANNQAIANAHRAPGGGPQASASTETQPQPQRPRVDVGA